MVPGQYTERDILLRARETEKLVVNWCIENPVRGQRFEPDDPRMRALEAYIYAQRKGTELNYGKHQPGGPGSAPPPPRSAEEGILPHFRGAVE